MVTMSAPQFTLGGLLSVITLICVCLGLFIASPGLGIFAAIAVLPALIRTVLLARRRERIGYPISTTDKYEAFLGSLGVVITSLVMLSIVAAATFFFVCLRTFNIGPHQRNDPNQDRDVWIILLIGGAFTIGVLTVIIRWVRKRWRRDTKDDSQYQQNNEP
jgi:hypothetical protein